jgi:D-sedoheptulose 7-phosphate isomerase
MRTNSPEPNNPGLISQSRHIIEAYLAEMRHTLLALPIEDIVNMVRVLEGARTQKKQVFLFGNGGSAATASHLAVDFSKGTISSGQPRLRAVALTDSLPLITAWANDVSYDDIFSQQLQHQAEPGDVAIGISSSGRSPNVVKALKTAKSLGATTIALTGRDCGHLNGLVDICIMVPDDRVGQIEDVHLMLGHIVTTCLRNEFHNRGQSVAESCIP